MARLFDMNADCWKEAINLAVIHPELVWYNVFGKPYIDLFGRDKLLATPCYRIHELQLGKIEVGYRSDVVLLDSQYQVQWALIDGKLKDHG
ncbi:hypothetical protein BCM02_11045 [Paenibacillus methanolicus]|uniref:Amidohydrolase family protein n=1 Tax=Paenibacillus methanolicus TaxID=582686 RepID=A0A5S5BXR4_9BACL|nr:hypothetical protein BCM02_11045 [Paenibacillus methanolicus]